MRKDLKHELDKMDDFYLSKQNTYMLVTYILALREQRESSTHQIYQLEKDYVDAVEKLELSRTHLEKMTSDKERFEKACHSIEDEVCEVLGRVLGFELKAEDHPEKIGAKVGDVFVGEHVAGSMAMLAAKAIKILSK